MSERGALLVLRVAGAAILLLTIVMLAVFPAAPVERNVPGFVSPVVGFELASTAEQVFGILGHPDNPARPAAPRSSSFTQSRNARTFGASANSLGHTSQ